MSNSIFDSLLNEKIEQFKLSFTNTSHSVFYDKAKKKLYHAGEYGMYRESIVRDFFKFITPSNLSISNGFLINTKDKVSSQCDIVIYDPSLTPICEGGDKQRFFPVESSFLIGEVKSTISKQDFKVAINKLAINKALGGEVLHPCIIKKHPPGNFDPKINAYDSIASILICQKLDFDLSNIENEIDSWYDPEIEDQNKHNMILSIEDGLLAYYDPSCTLPYSLMNGKKLKNRFTYPDTNPLIHFKFFSSYMYMLCSSKTLLYPEVTDYMAQTSGGLKKDEV